MIHWHPICPLEDIVPNTGVAARLNTMQVAVFRFGEHVYALGNHDPVTGAPVMARGLLGDRNGQVKVSSPIYKESYSLTTGVCLDDESKKLPTYSVRVNDGMVEVGLGGDGV